MTGHIFKTFGKAYKFHIFIDNIWIKHEKCIQMSTGKSSVGPVVLEITTPSFRIWEILNLLSHKSALWDTVTLDLNVQAHELQYFVSFANLHFAQKTSLVKGIISYDLVMMQWAIFHTRYSIIEAA